MTERAIHDLSDLAESSKIYISLKPSHRASVLASVDVELETNFGTITISDARILRNRAGVAWFSLPPFSVTKRRANTSTSPRLS